VVGAYDITSLKTAVVPRHIRDDAVDSAGVGGHLLDPAVVLGQGIRSRPQDRDKN
jgi:hypothetical protein